MTELLGKAHAWRHSRPGKTHRALVSFLQRLSHDRRAQQQLGFEGQNANLAQVIRNSIPLAQRVEDLAPALDRDGPNPEYPWPSSFPTAVPVEHDFDLWNDLNTPAGRRFLTLLRRLFPFRGTTRRNDSGNGWNENLMSDIESLQLYAGVHQREYGLHRCMSKRFGG